MKEIEQLSVPGTKAIGVPERLELKFALSKDTASHAGPMVASSASGPTLIEIQCRWQTSA